VNKYMMDFLVCVIFDCSVMGSCSSKICGKTTAKNLVHEPTGLSEELDIRAHTPIFGSYTPGFGDITPSSTG